MKKIRYVIYILFLFIIMFFILSKDNNIKHSIVFIEASNNEYLSKGMGFVYKIEKNINYIVTS